MKIVGIIPARFASTRFPGKPLQMIDGRSMIQRVYEQAVKCSDLTRVVVATDHEQIASHVAAFGGEAVMTSSAHKSGTERCAEALTRLSAQADYSFDAVINIQGDEPYIHPEQIAEVAGCLADPSVSIATLARKITLSDDLNNPNVVKVIFNNLHQVLLFSRSAIPFLRNVNPTDWTDRYPFYQHIGIYGYRSEILMQIVALPECQLEEAESLEQLRWMYFGIPIHVGITEYQSVSVDTPEDLLKITNRTV